MITIADLINKIKWDKRENPDEYSLFYVDRITRKPVEIKYKDIKQVKDGLIILQKKGEETQIPLHRIREVRRKGKTEWKR
ncbi:DUF504 domain-containing protein [Candidatus Woesearchaeota archaeon]|nr:DUF504 domain-containing protein [Candidatus Woesearchaeota archaeon]